MSEKLRNLHCLQKIYTAAGIDGSDKSHLWGALQEGAAVLLPFYMILTWLDL